MIRIHSAAVRRFSICLLAAVFLTSAWAPVPEGVLATPTSTGPAGDSAGVPAAVSDDRYQRAFIIPINDDMITDVTRDSLRRRVAQARDEGADLIVFELDTPGGLVTSALDICNDIQSVSDITTVAWVHPMAYSAGAMIAVSCDEVVLSRSGKMGACAPIMIGPGGGVESMPDSVQSKIESPIKATFTDASQRRGYDPLLCDAMVTIGTEIFWVENAESGKRKFVTTEQKVRLLGENDGGSVLSDLTKRPGQGESGSWRLVETFADAETGEPRSVRQPVVKADELLTLNANQAVAYGFARTIVNTEDELRTFYGLPGPDAVTVIHFDWLEKATAWLTGPTLRGILMMLLLMGAYMEFKTPGLGAGGAVALLALVLLLGAPYLTGLAGTWEIGAVIIGVVLMAVELFVLPGFGIAGMLGVLFILAGLLGTFVPAEPGPFHWPQLDATWDALRTGIITLIGGMLASLFGVWGLARYLPRVPVANQMFLDAETAQSQNLEAGAPVVGDAPVWVGAQGVSQTVLRPAGKALIDGQRFDVVTEGDMIDSGVDVQVVRVEGNRVVVRAVTNDSQTT